MGVLFAAFDHCIDQADRIKKCADELLVLPAVALYDFQSRGGLTDEGNREKTVYIKTHKTAINCM